MKSSFYNGAHRSLIHEALISLIEAKCTLTKPDRWTQKNYAIDKDGNAVCAIHTNACKYCVQGAIWHSALSRSRGADRALCPATIGDFAVSTIVEQATLFLIPHLPSVQGVFNGPGSRLIQYNDFVASHADVLYLLDKGIIDAKVAFEKELLEIKT